MEQLAALIASTRSGLDLYAECCHDEVEAARTLLAELEAIVRRAATSQLPPEVLADLTIQARDKEKAIEHHLIAIAEGITRTLSEYSEGIDRWLISGC